MNIENVFLSGPWGSAFSFVNEQEIKRDNLLTTLPVLKKEWRVSFEFKATEEIKDGFSQILHMTIGGMGAGLNAKYGDRTPAVWTHSTKGLLVVSAVGGKVGYSKYFKPLPTLGEWVKIKVGQELVGQQMIYSISIRGKEVHFVKNTKPAVFKNVGVFAGNRWHNPLSGVIRNLLIENKNDGRLL